MATAALFERDPRCPAQPAANLLHQPVPERPAGRRQGSVRPAADDRRPAGRPRRRSSKKSSTKFARWATTPRCWRRCGGSSAAKRCASPMATSSAISRSKRSRGKFPTWPMRSSKRRSITPGGILHEQYGMPLRAGRRAQPVRRARPRQAGRRRAELLERHRSHLPVRARRPDRRPPHRQQSGILRAAVERSDPPAHRADRPGRRVSRRSAAAAGRLARRRCA